VTGDDGGVARCCCRARFPPSLEANVENEDEDRDEEDVDDEDKENN